MRSAKFLIFSILTILLISCPNTMTDTDDDQYEYSIGGTGPAGGYIFYIDRNDEHTWTYLEVAPENTEWDSAVWCNDAYVVGEDAQGRSIGDGAGNTAAIVEAYEANPNVGNGFAAQLCDNLSVENGGETYADWFMPSQDELNEVYINLHNTDDPVGGFKEYQYWTSTESDAYTACDQYFGAEGTQGSHTKLDAWYLRAVRAF